VKGTSAAREQVTLASALAADSWSALRRLGELDLWAWLTAQALAVDRRHLRVFLVVFCLNLLAHGTILTAFIYTNHVFPNVWPTGFPTYRSFEGRWFHDVTWFLQGGAGITFLHSIVGIAVQVLTGILFARALNRTDTLSLFGTAALVSLFPYVGDYYSWSGDNVVLSLGDLLAVLGLIIAKKGLRFVPAAAIVWHMSLACNQTKVATIAVLICIYALALLQQCEGRAERLAEALRSAAAALLAFGGAVTLYFAILKLLYVAGAIPDTEHYARRLTIVGVGQIPGRLQLAMRDLGGRLSSRNDLVAPSVKWASALLAAGSVVALLTRVATTRVAGIRRVWTVLVATTVVGLATLSTQLTYVVSPNAYWPAARFRTVLAFFVAGLLVLPLDGVRRLYRNLLVVFLVFTVWSFVTTNAAVGQQAVMRSTAEVAAVSRIMSRIERLPGFSLDQRYALVVVGALPDYLTRSDIAKVDVRTNVCEPAFRPYRQTEMLNWLLGRQVFGRGVPADLAVAQQYASSQLPYPAEGSVVLLGGRLVVVVLDKYRPGIATTWVQPDGSKPGGTLSAATAAGDPSPKHETILGLPVASLRVPVSVPVREQIEDGGTVWLLHARSELQLELPPGASGLSVRYGLARGSYAGNGRTDGATFSVSLLRPDGRRELLWTRRLDPRAEPGDRGMHLESLTFAPNAGTRLVLETDPGSDGAWDWTLWSDLRVR